MAKQANVPILVAINKIDARNADIYRTKRMLVEAGIQAENQLTEVLVLQAKLLNVMADPIGLVDIHRGKLCTAIVQRGRIISEVSPGYPAELYGWKYLPSTGELVVEVKNEKQAKSAFRAGEQRMQKLFLQKNNTIWENIAKNCNIIEA
ncbi:hypothetical protein QE152_g13245 [Popillia japonica]|uniref:Uncharacterized protein n=1 Tax=Popillia japonica TaxID=7064 RepID=A0AAW1LDZ2_POPJA